MAGLGLILFLLVGCARAPSADAPSAAAPQVEPSASVPTPTSVPSLAPVLAAGLTLPLSVGVGLPLPSAVISPENAGSLVEISSWTGHGCSVFSVTFSPDSRTLASTSCDSTVRTWDLVSGSELRTLGQSEVEFGSAFSPDGTLLAAWSNDDTIRVYDAATGSIVHTLVHTAHVWGAAISPDGGTLASGGEDGTISVWDLGSGSALPSLDGDLGELYGSPIHVREVDFSPDGTMLASTDDDDAMGLWDLASGTRLRRIPIVDVFSAVFTPDGSMLLVATARRYNNMSDSEIIYALYDVATGSRIRTFSGDPDKANSMAISPDGTLLAIGLGTYDAGRPVLDGAIVLYDMTNGEELRRLTGHTDLISALAFSPDGLFLASGGSDHDRTIRLWGVYP
jgi:WD40 repeat protein